ncbi:MFS transporter [Salaquimonas pukyongi]|uniref:MFS transporter n=1 Tax=Salaquimonas pukyongi TaxID=2712698 RepID=UPI00096BCD82|nr:MFS transporter [Salaquimonas pukyongi]
MLFDWAAQPFFTIVTTFIFGPYFVSRLAEDPAQGQAVWTFGIAAAGLVIAVLSPILGSIADQTGPRKPWIAIFAVVKIAALFALWNAEPGANLFLIVSIFALAMVSAEFSIVFNDSMLPRLVSKEGIGRVSNIAWGLGYLGGMIMLIVVVAFLAASPDTGKTFLGFDPLFGLDPAKAEGDRITGPLSAVWYFIFVLPMFLFTPDSGGRRKISQAVSRGLTELKTTLIEARQRAGIFRFLVARMIYQDGVNALLALGGAFAASMFGWLTAEIGIFGIILNIVAIPGCFAAAWLDTRFGSKWVVTVSILLLFVATLGIVSTGPGYTLFGLLALPGADTGGLFGTPAEKAYIAYGLLIGLAFGPVQASSRSWLARSVTEDEAGRYFGLYAFAGRATSFLAPFLIGVVTSITISQRAGMAVILIFLLVGFLIIRTTPYPADNPQE